MKIASTAIPSNPGKRPFLPMGKRLEIQRARNAVTVNGAEYKRGIPNINADFLGDFRSADAWMRMNLDKVRSQSRALERSNPYVQNYLAQLVNNVLGAKGVNFQSKIETSAVYGDLKPGEPDERANEWVETSYRRFGRKENFSVTKDVTRQDADMMLLRRLAVDGEIICRKVPGYSNDYKFAWQFIENDYLDHNLNKVLPNGNLIISGVEVDGKWKNVVAYWLLKRRPLVDFPFRIEPGEDVHTRVPEDHILHLYVRHYPEQRRGFPWMFAAILELHMLGKYREAAIVNARIGASKMGFFKKTIPEAASWDGQPIAGDNGEIVDEVTPGEWVELPFGVEPVNWEPKYPEAEFGAFNEAVLMGIACAAGMSYMSFTGDMSKANFSSLRHGVNSEREGWMSIQEYWIRNWKEPSFEEELFRSLISGNIPLPVAKIEKFNKPQFKGRRWPFVNPVQDIQARMMEVDLCSKSISDIIEESGGDPWETFKKIAQDDKWMKELGIARVRNAFKIVDFESVETEKLTQSKDAGKSAEE